MPETAYESFEKRPSLLPQVANHGFYEYINWKATGRADVAHLGNAALPIC